jgi:hypothetical protein
MKVAKLVTVSLTTRVIVEDTDTDEQIMEKAIPQLEKKLAGDGTCDNIESIVDDEEIPFGDLISDGKRYSSNKDEIHNFLLDLETITTDGMEIVLEKIYQILNKLSHFNGIRRNGDDKLMPQKFDVELILIEGGVRLEVIETNSGDIIPSLTTDLFFKDINNF